MHHKLFKTDSNINKIINSYQAAENWKWRSCWTLCDPMDYTVCGILRVRILEWVAFSFSRGSSQIREWTQVSHICRQILYQLSHKGSPRTLAWVAYPFSSGSSWPRNQTRVSCIAGNFFFFFLPTKLSGKLSSSRRWTK